MWESRPEMEYVQIEKLTNLAGLPQPTGFTIAALPVKLEKASGSWTRAVTIFEE